MFEAEPNVNSNEIHVPVLSSKESSWQDSTKRGQEENETIMVSGDANYRQTSVPSANGKSFFYLLTSLVCVSVLSTGKLIKIPIVLDLLNLMLCFVLECESCADLDKPAGGSPTVIRSAELSQKESGKEGVKGSTEQTVSVGGITDGDASKVCSVSQDPKQSDLSKDSFTFEVCPPADLPEKEVGKKWQPFSNIQAGEVSPVVLVFTVVLYYHLKILHLGCLNFPDFFPVCLKIL